MARILCVYCGNICRSTMTKFIMKVLVKKAGLESQSVIESVASNIEKIGCPVYPPARHNLAEHGTSCVGKTARRLIHADSDR